MIGIGVLLLFVFGVGYAVSKHDWESLRTVCLFAGALIFALALLSGTAWLVVKVFTRRRGTPRPDGRPMRKSKLLLLVFAFCLIGAWALVYYFASPAPGTVAYHLQKLGRVRTSKSWKWGPKFHYLDSAGRPVPGNALAYANPKTWIWYLNGRPTITSTIEEQEKQQQALIRLGYFERRELTFSHRTLDAELWSQFRTAVSNAPLSEPCYMLHIDDSRRTMIGVTTSKADLPVFERIVTQLDKR